MIILRSRTHLSTGPSRTALADRLNVGGDLPLDGLSYPTTLPDGLRVSGSLGLAGLSSLTTLPDGLRVGGNLRLWGATSLTALPAGLSAGGDLILGECTSLTALPNGLRVRGDLNLRYCTSLTALPEGLSVGRDLNLDDCTALTALPDDINIGRNLNLSFCTSLTALPERLNIAGALNLSHCTALTALPDGLYVGLDLNLYGCTSLTALPDELNVGLNCNLSDCTSLTALSVRLNVRGHLSLSGCTSLTALPDQLSVGGDLDLYGCTSLTALPDRLSVGGNLRLRNCPSLTTLPNAIFDGTWRPRADGRPHIIDIRGSNIPSTVVQQLRLTGINGFRIIFEAPTERHAATRFATVAAARDFWLSQAGANFQAGVAPNDDAAAPAGWTAERLGLDEEQERQVCHFMARMTDTAEHQNVHTRPILAQRLLALLEALRDQPQLRQRCMHDIAESTESCSDRVLLALNDLDIAILVDAAQHSADPAQTLEHLGRRLHKLDVVRAEAQRHVNSLADVDPVEVYLAYEIGLAEVLDLPVATRHMLYPECAQVKAADLSRAQRAVEAAAADAPQVLAFLLAWSPWQRLQRQELLAGFDPGRLPSVTLSPTALAELATALCPITQEPLDALERPVLVPHTGGVAGSGWTLYEFAALSTWWTEHGSHPIAPHQRLRLGPATGAAEISEVYRLER